MASSPPGVGVSMPGELGQSCRAVDVGRLYPALPAADHPASNPWRSVVAPVREQRIERGAELPVVYRS